MRRPEEDPPELGRTPERRAEDLADRLKRRMELLEKERFHLGPQPPRVRGGAWSSCRKGCCWRRLPPQLGPSPRLCRRPGGTAISELKAMEAVIKASGRWE